MTATDQLRDAFVSQLVVTAEQWEEAAVRSGGTPGAVLRELATQPAWWDATERAVTGYHIKLVEHLEKQNALDQLDRGLRLGRFLIREELGRGGMGVVYLAWDPDAGRLVALKRIRGQGRQLRARFQREAKVLARLDHPAIARFLAVEQIGKSDVIVMEYVRGVSASRHVRRLARAGRQLPWHTAVAWASQVLDALSHAHGRQVVHRDIKPGNVMVQDGPGTAVKLLDLGLAKCGDDEAGGDEPLTRDGQALGTREYMPPEQWVNGGAVTAAADLYALGGTLFYLLAGRPPYEADSSYRIMNMHLTAAVPSVRAIRPDAPEALDAVIQRMLAKNPAHRGTARELAWQLGRVLATPRTAEAPAPPHPAADAAPHAPPSASSVSVARVPDTQANARPSQTTLTGSRVGPLLREMAGEVGRMFGKQSASVLDAPPTERLPALAGEMARTLWDGLLGRRPDARRAAWATVSAGVLGVAGLVWMTW